MIDIDASYFIILGLFLLLWMVLRPILFAPYLQSIATRDTRTRQARAEAEALDVRANDVFQRYDREFGAARHAASEVRSSLRQEGAGAKDSTLAQAREAASAHLQETRGRVGAEMEKAHAAVADEVSDVARLLAEKILGRSV